ncbi:coatomer subunit alpha-2-like isoform X1 [Hibiscus syriacus]|uniref:Coatomer subunit alpha-2-like isoform X1 n=1 Tax=Hibiscus syriacus TaxID=106335 RepID=A0A6A3AVT6_HIBSY|nr:coatomer subunit alpha-2-like isoform X1 [Hibiscus syriacus]
MVEGSSKLERKERFETFTSTTSIDWRRRRRTLICAVNQDAEKAFKKTVEVDRLIDMLREANPTEKDYEELATAVMSIVDRIVHKTHEKIDSATDVLKEILKPVVDEEEETPWPPKILRLLNKWRKIGLLIGSSKHSFSHYCQKIIQMDQDGQLDEGFLAEVSAQLRQLKILLDSGPVKELVTDNYMSIFELTLFYSEVSMAKEDADKPGLEAMLQKVLQLYASTVLSKRSYAKKGNEVVKAEHFLETVIKAPEQEWNKLLIDGLTIGKGEISTEDFYAVIKKRIERTLIRTEGGSYQQRILTEYLKGIEARTEEIVQFLRSNAT